MSEHLEATDDRQVTLARQDAIPIADGAGHGFTLTPASTLSIGGEPKSSQAWPGQKASIAQHPDCSRDILGQDQNVAVG